MYQGSSLHLKIVRVAILASELKALYTETGSGKTIWWTVAENSTQTAFFINTASKVFVWFFF